MLQLGYLCIEFYMVDLAGIGNNLQVCTRILVFLAHICEGHYIFETLYKSFHSLLMLLSPFLKIVEHTA